MVSRPWRKNRERKQGDLGFRAGRRGFPGGSSVKNAHVRQGMRVQFPGGEDPLGEGMATQSSILAWGLPWTEECSRLRSMGLDMTERLHFAFKSGNRAWCGEEASFFFTFFHSFPFI